MIMMMISGPYPLDELRRIAENDVQPRLERLPGIASCEVAGGLQREIHVVLDPAKVSAFGLDVNAIVGAIYRENTQAPGGSIKQGALDFTIQTHGKYRNVAEIGEVVVGVKQDAAGSAPLRLKEVARVEDSFTEDERILEVDGVPAIWLIVRKQSGANTVISAEAVTDAMPVIKREAAADIDFRIIYNQAEFINLSLGNLSSTTWIAIGITFLVLLYFLRNLRSSLIVSASIPLSIIATFAVMDFAHITLNVISLAGLALAVGMLVDNSIVVLENIFRLREEEGYNAWDAAIEGARTVGLAVTASTLTTMVVFVPVLFVPGIAGVIFKDMALTICFSLWVSLVVSITFIPLAASRLLGTKRAEKLLARARGRDAVAPMRNLYRRSLRWTLDRRWLVGVSLAALMVITGLLAAVLPTEFVAEEDQLFVFVTAETAVGNNLQEAYSVIREAIKVVKDEIKPEERKMIALDMGQAKGFDAIFSKGVHAGTIQVPLVMREKRKRDQKQIEEALRQRLLAVPGLKATVSMPLIRWAARETSK